ncbi:MAG TPA: ATP-binding protein [Polyangiales bacterium]|nr:ATP-binding protein [Polyangiales bacterium]
MGEAGGKPGVGVPLGDEPQAEPTPYVAEIALDGTIIGVSSPLPGFTVDQIVGTKIQRWVDAGAQAALQSALSEVLTSSKARNFVWIGAQTGRPFESRLTPVWRDGQLLHLVMTTEDISARMRNQQALRESEQRFDALVQNAFEGLAITVDGTILVLNEALAHMLRAPIEEIVGRSGYDFCAPEMRSIARGHVQAGDETPYEVVGVRADGTRYPCELLGRNIVYHGMPARLTAFRDLTERHRVERERKEIEAQLGQAQKLESLGMLAGGIAHDFNNLLMVMLATSEDVLERPNLPPELAARVAEIRNTALRGRELTRQLLSYASQGPLTVQPLDLVELVRDTVALIGVSISKKAELVLDLPEQPAVVLGDSGQLRQLIMNLVINASEALGDRVGRIEVRIAHARAGAGQGSRPVLGEVPAADSITLSVRDTGQGMSPETRQRMFDPFFTTKASGRGLGLAAVLNVVRGHHGAIFVQSEPGAGTEVVVWLERCAQATISQATAPAARPERSGRGTVLVVDDEPMLRTLASSALKALGFESITAADGEEALRLVAEHAPRLSLVLLDLTMPKLSGVETLRRMRESGQRVPVLCTSGYSAELVAADLARIPKTGFVAKPYSLAELSAAIDALIAD